MLKTNDLMDVRAELLIRARAMKPLIEKLEDRMEEERHLPVELREAMADAGFFRMWIPKEFGGLETDPVTLFEVVEELSRTSGSVGWNLMIGASFGWFAADLKPDTAREIYEDPNCILAGQINAIGGKAVKVPGGYKVNGKWAFASGIYQANWILSNFFVFEDGEVVLGANGFPEVLYFIVPKSDVEVIDSWHTMGLRGTGSNDYAMEDVFVPEDRVFKHPAAPIHQDGPLYKVIQAFGHIIPVPMLGMARGALDAYADMARTRKTRLGGFWNEDPTTQHEYVMAEGLLRAGRTQLWEADDNLYEMGRRGEKIEQEHMSAASLAMIQAGILSTQAVDIVFDVCGGSAVYKKNPLERRFRDIHTARQHSAFNRERTSVLGRTLLGVPERARMLPQL